MNALKKFSLVAALLLIASVVRADYNPQNWQYTKPIDISGTDSREYVKVKLDRDILTHSAGLDDIRIISGGRDVGYQLITEDATTRTASYPSSLLNLSSRNGRTYFIVDLGSSGNVHSRINIITSSLNFRRQVSVSASDYLLPIGDSSWRLLTSRGYIYNYYDQQASFSAGSGEVTYPQNTSRYLQVVIQPGEGSDPVISNARVYRYEIQEAEEDTITLPLTITQNEDQKSTELEGDFGYSGIPTHSISLSSTDRNFNRRAVVQMSSDKVHWTLVSQGTLFNLATSLFTGSEFTLDYPEQTYRYIRVVVHNDDDAPVTFKSSATVKSTARYVVFEAMPNASYTMAYGNSSATTPKYDISRFFKYIEVGNLAEASLGNESLNTAYVPPPAPVIPLTERYPHLLAVVLVLLVIIVAGFVFAYLKKLREMESKRGRR
jgi:hypothetical protein